jgi:hypothetical protein
VTRETAFVRWKKLVQTILVIGDGVVKGNVKIGSTSSTNIAGLWDGLGTLPAKFVEMITPLGGNPSAMTAQSRPIPAMTGLGHSPVAPCS